jgi:hypothetical protein
MKAGELAVYSSSFPRAFCSGGTLFPGCLVLLLAKRWIDKEPYWEIFYDERVGLIDLNLLKPNIYPLKEDKLLHDKINHNL